MQIFARLAYGALTIFAIVANFAISGVIIAAIDTLHWLAYPAYFGSYMLLAGLVFTVIVPAHRKRTITIPFLQRFLNVDGRRFDHGAWGRIRQQGPLALTLASSLLLGPFFAALVIRFLGLPEHKAWMYAFASTLAAAAVWVSFYLGLFGLIRSQFLNVFG